VQWVDWLVTRYQLGHVIPPCWWAHGPMVEELSALETAWRGAYGYNSVAPDSGVIWHEHLARCLVRLQEWNVERCAYGDHRPATYYDLKTDLSWPAEPAQPAQLHPDRTTIAPSPRPADADQTQEWGASGGSAPGT
jgi:hypothetical protein